MKRRRSAMGNYLSSGVGLVGAGVVMGNMPNPTNIAEIETMKTAGMTGLGNVAATFPIQGKIIGAGMTFKSIKKLSKFSKSRRSF